MRFAVALRMCAEAGLRAEKTLHYCFRATCNSAFMRGEERAVEVVKRGGDLHEALDASGAPFPAEFREMVLTGEETGNMSEVMERLANSYREEAERKLKLAAQFTSYAIYGLVALMIIFSIFRIASSLPRRARSRGRGCKTKSITAETQSAEKTGESLKHCLLALSVLICALCVHLRRIPSSYCEPPTVGGT